MNNQQELVIEELNAIMYDKIEDPDNLRPFYTVEKEHGIISLYVNVGEEQYSIFQTISEKEMNLYLKGMIRGLKVERKPIWKH